MIVALLASFAFVFAILGLGLLAHTRFGSFVARKVVHIGVAHWWFFYFWGLQDLVWGLIGPLFFVLFNALAAYTRIIKPLNPEPGERNLGTVYFPISLAVLVILDQVLGMPGWIGLLAILILGWGDGLAALVGRSLPLAPLDKDRGGKSWGGVLAIIAATLVISLFVGALWFDGPYAAWLAFSLVLALVVALVEAFSPWGLDNLIIPGVVTAMTWIFVGIIPWV